MERLELEFDIVTPMFIAGAEQKPAELRTQSIKGVLRFWWRALAYFELRNEFRTGDSKKILDELAKREGEIFGKGGLHAKKSSFALTIKTESQLVRSEGSLPYHPVQVQSKGEQFPINILEYLCYGTNDYKGGKRNVFKREYIKENQKFRLILRFDEEQYRDETLKALYLLSEYGGLGSRARNGFGSVQFSWKSNPASFRMKLEPGGLKQMLAGAAVREKPPFTSFSSQTALWETGESESWDKCLSTLGKIYRSARGQMEPKHQYRLRGVFGAPLVVNREDQAPFNHRSAKPCFLKVYRTLSGKYTGRILFMPHLLEPNMEMNRKQQALENDFEAACRSFCSYLDSIVENKNATANNEGLRRVI